jgi:poly(3-hydroxybutyrate) depolymerase
MSENPHKTVPITVEGTPLESAPLALVMVHGRSLNAAYMRENVAARLDRADLAYVLPEADENSWYPESFLRPIEENQPRLDWALERLDDVRQLLANAGVKDHHIVWLGFSQGACLVSEYVARSSRHFGAMVCFTGGLIAALASARDCGDLPVGRCSRRVKCQPGRRARNRRRRDGTLPHVAQHDAACMTTATQDRDYSSPPLAYRSVVRRSISIRRAVSSR